MHNISATDPDTYVVDIVVVDIGIGPFGTVVFVELDIVLDVIIIHSL